MMKRLLLQLTLGAGLLVPTLALAQEKPSLNTAPPTPVPAPVQPGPVTPAPTPAAEPAAPAATTPALPPPSYSSPSGFELPQREQERKAAQEHSEMFSKLFIYSGIGLNYGSSYYSDGGVFNFSISPALGYRLNDRVAIGPGISYAYTNYSFGQGYPSMNLNSLGVKVFGQVLVYKQFLVHAEYEVTQAELPVVDANGYYVLNTRTNQFLTGKRTITSPLAGVGYRSQFSSRAAADFLVLYNFNDSFNNSIYSNPVIRINFLFNIGH